MYLNKIRCTYNEKGIYTTAKKISKNVLIRIIRNLTYNRKNVKKWNNLAGKFKGKRVFLIGNGPSLNKTPLYLLKNEYTMCFNRINILFERLSWRPYFYACIDETVLEDSVDEINSDILPYVNYAFFPELFKYELRNKKKIESKEKVLWFYYDFSEFSFCLPFISRSPTVATAALQILSYLGFSEIYLIGVDMDYKLHTTAENLKNNEIQSKYNDDPNHFDSRYFGKGRKYHQPTPDVIKNMFNSFERVKKNISKISTKIYNATYGGKLELFERVQFENLFNYSDEERFKLFSESFSSYALFNNYKEMNSKLSTISSYKEAINSTNTILLIKQRDFIHNSPKFISLFMLFGPFKSKYILIKRK